MSHSDKIALEKAIRFIALLQANNAQLVDILRHYEPKNRTVEHARVLCDMGPDQWQNEKILESLGG